jgi:hypothetical protein
MDRPNLLAVVICALLVPLIALAVAAGGTVLVLVPVIVLGLLALFLAGRSLGRRDGDRAS